MDIEAGCSSSTIDHAESYREPQETVIPLLGDMDNSTYARRIAKRRKLRREFNYDHPRPFFNLNVKLPNNTAKQTVTFHNDVSSISSFHQRTITTIHEEVFQYKKQSKTPFNQRAMKSKGKEYKEKVASLKVIISRLKKTNLTEPEVLKNNFPEETIQLFERIHI